ncbi:MAG: hypothetical protein FP814_14205 [Desulfobacterium sp.]|nr:hypothetical protein [Desulfobacterium sp.]MBU3948125.1 hypothetical protein [Pseudomonadota bacterium]MBU4035191.1 hypothetical protein [Pseudomonadota bacterium]
MNPLAEKIISQEEKYSGFLPRLELIYKTMDDQYNELSRYYGFCCTGCDDNCCFTRFYHHTFAEYLYIKKGLETLDPENRKEIKEKAFSICRQTSELDQSGLQVHLLCPLNYGGMCVLYAYRPMICRLHGLPHELVLPGREKRLSPGCDEFESQCGTKGYVEFDRTPFYASMAELERDIKKALDISERIKMTVAEMLTTL